ncbi:MAG: hypothetical protein Q4Q53_08275 [Methanocorpusculum sp.]|nr:hypothetical protein [Methanocorpusculum sp.]
MNEGGSYYLYDEKIILDQLAILKNAFPQVRIFYSAKTNPNKNILETLTKNGCGIDAASSAEVGYAAALNLAKEDISYSSPGKTKEDIKRTICVCRIVADSFSELELINETAKEKGLTAEISLRINPDFSMFGADGLPSQFGVDEEAVLSHKPFIDSLTNVKITGIHVHIQSQILDWAVLSRYYENVFRLAVFLKNSGFDIKIINFGSGPGVVYDRTSEKPLDIERLSKDMSLFIEKYNSVLNAELIIEPGRFLVCQAGNYFTKIVDKKISRGTVYLIVEGGLNGFMRPCAANLVKKFAKEISFSAEPLITNNNPCEFFVLNDSTRKEIVTVAGNLCSGSDILAKDVVLNEAKVGDMIMVTNAGSYGYSLSVREFAGQRTPKEYFKTLSGEILCTASNRFSLF